MRKNHQIDFESLFPDEREKGETALRQSQLVMLRMLKILDYLCKRHEIKYFLTGGTLLGAIRHQAFIPWDDDLDVGMTRDNYEKFLSLAVPELPNDIFFQNADTDIHYPQTCNVDARLRDKYSSYKLIEREEKGHLGLQIDIFVYDRAFFPTNTLIAIQNRLLELLNDHKKRAKILKFISKWSPVKLIYSSNFIKGFKQVATYINNTEYNSLVRHRFEDMDALIPLHYDSYLKRQYGDYMQLPPIEERKANHKAIVQPFTPCDHEDVLLWENRHAGEIESF